MDIAELETPRREARCCTAEREFLQMSRCYGQHGGLASGDEVAWRMRRHCDQPLSLLARRIARREVVNLTWRSQILLPLFQFTNAGMRVYPVVRSILAELADVFDDWEITAWFAQPNTFLCNQRPLSLVGVDDACLLQAARADRFVARG